MTNEQLFFAIGVPLAFNGLIAFLLNSKIGSAETLLSNRISDLVARIGSLETKMDTKITSLESKIDNMRKEILDELKEIRKVTK